MADLKPAYLIHGDDHGAIAERRAGLRALAEGGEGGPMGVELIEGERATPVGVADALAAMTLGLGTRVILVEGVERWRDADVERELLPAMGQIPAGTTLALFAREEARAKAPAALAQAVRRAGGQVVAQMTVKPWEMPKWAAAQAARMGLSLDVAASKALVAQVGERQQRLLRELETLALEGAAPGSGASISAEDIERRAASSAEVRAFSLADALLAGRVGEATLCYLRLREQGERLPGLIYLVAQRLREGLAAAIRLQAGEPASRVRPSVRLPPRAAERFLENAARADPARLRGALVALADLELDSRGGALLASGRSAGASLGEETLALRAIERICA